jgi:hypothetical protein
MKTAILSLLLVGDTTAAAGRHFPNSHDLFSM